MYKMYKEEHTEAVLLVDAVHSSNSVNRKDFLHNIDVVCPLINTYVQNCYTLPSRLYRKDFLHNIDVVCPLINTYVQNCYTLPSRLFIIGGTEIKSSEGTTQGDPVARPIYALAVIPLCIPFRGSHSF